MLLTENLPDNLVVRINLVVFDESTRAERLPVLAPQAVKACLQIIRADDQESYYLLVARSDMPAWRTRSIAREVTVVPTKLPCGLALDMIPHSNA